VLQSDGDRCRSAPSADPHSAPATRRSSPRTTSPPTSAPSSTSGSSRRGRREEGGRTSASTRDTPRGRGDPAEIGRSCWSRKLVGALRAVAAQTTSRLQHYTGSTSRREVSQALREMGARLTLESSPSPSWRRPRWPRCARTTSSAPRPGDGDQHAWCRRNCREEEGARRRRSARPRFAREQEINVATQTGINARGKAKEEEAASGGDRATGSDPVARPAASGRHRLGEGAEGEDGAGRGESTSRRPCEAAQVDKQRTIETAKSTRRSLLTLKDEG